ncbi:MAG TPA: hypothetical protein VH796_09560 [Nitrososphaeraceae archaeon]
MHLDYSGFIAFILELYICFISASETRWECICNKQLPSPSQSLKTPLLKVKVTFHAKNVYQLEITIKALQRTGQSVPDLSRNGIARGYVVIPKFLSVLN